MDIKQWLHFDRMITPGIIKNVYWLLLFFTIASGILGMLMSPFTSPITLVILILSIIALRISCEMIILMFNIYQQLKKIADNIPAGNTEKADIPD
ncbi:DUF4282 domain-containing protein [Salmonella enterica]|uniref:DUF4282 domain-containing protein n=2 Tax=Salmonella enterica TaxID=28901 RepID=A0A403T212_SALER|nr:DUF4282 domain-containing protein [Salmonella sp. SG203]EAB7739617.1 DUF4282 domain-containing protein [Salmonella enterica subsp. enterica serovar Hadar]EAV6575335.1 DUF4282 domain-containing protein [Salmonella enterica]EBQ9003681.1 hypothetical protein [Salmonella enterica subsp. enterica serovar Blockley]EBR8259011.1 hypothetical protein [Salmonella enterica subsp. enterica serovar Cerro]EBW7251937.1 hypothetical protein [Salmonella enterica subsp. enterica serovar Gatow]EBX7469035.1 h